MSDTLHQFLDSVDILHANVNELSRIIDRKFLMNDLCNQIENMYKNKNELGREISDETKKEFYKNVLKRILDVFNIDKLKEKGVRIVSENDYEKKSVKEAYEYAKESCNLVKEYEVKKENTPQTFDILFIGVIYKDLVDTNYLRLKNVIKLLEELKLNFANKIITITIIDKRNQINEYDIAYNSQNFKLFERSADFNNEHFLQNFPLFDVIANDYSVLKFLDKANEINFFNILMSKLKPNGILLLRDLDSKENIYGKKYTPDEILKCNTEKGDSHTSFNLIYTVKGKDVIKNIKLYNGSIDCLRIKAGLSYSKINGLVFAGKNIDTDEKLKKLIASESKHSKEIKLYKVMSSTVYHYVDNFPKYTVEYNNNNYILYHPADETKTTIKYYLWKKNDEPKL